MVRSGKDRAVPVFADVRAELRARAQIKDLLARHSRGIDRNDHAGERRSTYHSDAVVDSGGGVRSVDSLLSFRAREHEQTAHTSHMVTNVLIEFCSVTRAVVESYAIAEEREEVGYDFSSRKITDPGAAGAQIVSWCRYVDIIEAIAGEWRIRERLTIFGDTFHRPLPEPVRFPPGTISQCHGADDPMYRVRERAYAYAAGHPEHPRS
jgi:SnoaL-like domain